MAGHSHWKNIKRKKAVTDARRGKEWSKIARVIIVAAQHGGNPNDNFSLRLAMEKARAVNMPRDTIEKAVKKGTGELGKTHYEEVNYEGYGPGGVAIMVESLTDNRNRTAGEIRMLFDKHGGRVGAANSVGWMFAKRGIIAVEKSKVSEDKLMELALDAGADDVQSSDEGFAVSTGVAVFEKVKKALQDAKIELAAAELTMVPSQTIALSAEHADSLQKIVESLEDHDDVQNVYTNVE